MPQCPSCDKRLSTDVGVKSHHKQVHGESIAGKQTECSHCGDTFSRVPSHVERVDNPFCSPECRDQWRRENWTHPSKGEHRVKRVLVECSECGEEIREVTEWYAEEYAANHFCSNECKSKFQSDDPEWGNWNAKDKITVECAWCGEGVEKYPERTRRGSENYFCGHRCYANFKSEHLSGENSPSWKGGYEPYYGPNWPHERQVALDRDSNKCQYCGSAERLIVHHIVPLRKFDRDFKTANDLSNLVTLCRSCHSDWEGVPLRPRLANAD